MMMKCSSDWLKRLEKAQVICSHCRKQWNKTSEWFYVFDGISILWKHKCKSGKIGFGVMKKQLIREQHG
jgi:hypothetical protein